MRQIIFAASLIVVSIIIFSVYAKNGVDAASSKPVDGAKSETRRSQSMACDGYDEPAHDFLVFNPSGDNRIFARDNDGNHPGWFWVQPVDQVDHGVPVSATSQIDGDYFTYNAYSYFTGVDSFTYRYNLNQQQNPCQTSEATVFLDVTHEGDRRNAGGCPIPPMPSPHKALPVNVTNGNMWLEQTDYVLPGPGEPIEVNRFYNSMIQTSGLFGLGWSTKYDESLKVYSDTRVLRYHAPDGKTSYFARRTSTDPFKSFSPGMKGQIVKNDTDNTYTLTFHDGRVHKFNPSGRLLWQKDRNGNQTTLNYNTGGVLTGISDVVGRTLTISMGSNGHVSQISDSMATVATYEYYPSSTKLKTVTYNDGSKYKFEYTDITIQSVTKTFLTTVKDAYDYIREKHDYDSSGRATTSERHGGVEKFTFAYDVIHPNPYYGKYTNVTDENGHATSYFYRTQSGINIITWIFGDCSSCGTGSEYTYHEYELGYG